MWYKREAECLTVHLYVQPGAKKNEITGIHDNELKIRLKASPIEGRANKELLNYLAEIFDVPMKQISLKRGLKTRHKQVIITNSAIDPEHIIPSCAIHHSAPLS